MPEAAANLQRQARPTRRKVLRIVAGLAGVPLMMAGVRAAAPRPQFFRWNGEVLGAVAELGLWHTDGAAAKNAILKMRLEIERLERIFSLYRSDSEIARLNAEGRLAKPSPELRKLVAESQRLADLSTGAFDITVQPLWRLYEAHFWSHTDKSADIAAKAHEMASALVDYRRIDSSKASMGFTQQGMAITLNSLAQGYITDFVAGMLREDGFQSAVVDMGEYRAIGHRPDGRPWSIGISKASAPMNIARNVDLADQALAVSGGYGTTFEPSGRFHHIFDPHTGASAHRLIDVAVIGPTATAANGLSTAICVAGEARAAALLSAYPGTRAMLTRLDGTCVTVTANGPVAA